MLRRRRCTTCGTSFYASADHTGTHCQTCSGSAPDKTEEIEKEIELIEKANSQPKGREQVYNPRTGKSQVQEAEEKARAKKS